MIVVNQRININVNYLHGLFVGMTVMQDIGAGPEIIGSVIPMTNIIDTLYVGIYSPTVVGAYTFFYAVYTDGTYSTISSHYGRGAITEQCVDLGIVWDSLAADHKVSGSFGLIIGSPTSSSGDIIGLICNDNLVGYINETDNLIGNIESNEELTGLDSDNEVVSIVSDNESISGEVIC